MSYRHRSGLVPAVHGISPQSYLAGLLTPSPNPPPQTETTLWNGDISTGDFSQYIGPPGHPIQHTATSGTASVGSHTVLSVITAPAGLQPGNTHALKAETFGDSTGQTGSPASARAELNPDQQTSMAPTQGNSFWYECYFIFPQADNGGGTAPGWSNAVGWNIIFQTSPGGAFNTPKIGIQNVSGVPNLYFESFTGTLTAPVSDFKVFFATLQYDVPYRWRMFVQWSNTKATGLVQLFLSTNNGPLVEVVPLQAAQTLASNGGVPTFKCGMYRPQSNGANNNTVVMNGMRRFSIP